MASSPSLYTTLGGEPAITAVVEAFYERVLADPALAGFFRGVPMRRLKSHQIAFLTVVLRDSAHNPLTIQRAHLGRGIEDCHFDRVAQHLVETLRAIGVSEPLVNEVVLRVAPLRSQVVNVVSPLDAALAPAT